jgi:hypothetical protein
VKFSRMFRPWRQPSPAYPNSYFSSVELTEIYSCTRVQKMELRGFFFGMRPKSSQSTRMWRWEIGMTGEQVSLRLEKIKWFVLTLAWIPRFQSFASKI